MARAMLSRARDAPLIIHYPSSVTDQGRVRSGLDWFPPIVFAALKDLTRICELNLTTTPNGWIRFLTDFTTPAPNLHVLRVNTPAQEVWQISPDLLDSMAPLRTS
jgi:hypothetical protein